jgi:hypothetical protein
VVNNASRTVSEINAITGTIIDTIPVGSAPFGIAADDAHAWETNQGDNDVTEITPDAVPDAPSGVTVTAGDAQATVSWSAPADEGGSSVSSYSVQYSSDNGTTWDSATMCSGTAMNCTVTGLTSGTSYLFEVAATNAVGTGAFSASSAAVTPAAPPVTPSPSCAGAGYRLASANGGVFAFGKAPYLGSLPGEGISVHDIVGIAGSACGGGYWLVGSDGGVYAFGSAGFYGSAAPIGVRDVVGMAVAADAKGYWLVSADGGVFAFGDARFYGSMATQQLNAPVVGITAAADGKGYYLVAADGGVFAFGSARYEGSMAAHHLNGPVVGIKAATSGAGYNLVAADGGVFSFGAAAFGGSMGGQPPAGPVVTLIRDPGAAGYEEIGSGGGVYAFGGAPFFGSLPASSAATSAIVGADATGTS